MEVFLQYLVEQKHDAVYQKGSTCLVVTSCVCLLLYLLQLELWVINTVCQKSLQIRYNMYLFCYLIYCPTHTFSGTILSINLFCCSQQFYLYVPVLYSYNSYLYVHMLYRSHSTCSSREVLAQYPKIVYSLITWGQIQTVSFTRLLSPSHI